MKANPDESRFLFGAIPMKADTKESRYRWESIGMRIKFDESRSRFKSIPLKGDVDQSRCRSKSISTKVDADISRFQRFTLKVCFSESARKMMQNGGRVVAIGSIFDVIRSIFFHVLNKCTVIWNYLTVFRSNVCIKEFPLLTFFIFSRSFWVFLWSLWVHIGSIWLQSFKKT